MALKIYQRGIFVGAAAGACYGGVSAGKTVMREEIGATAVLLTPAVSLVVACFGAFAGATAAAVFPITACVAYNMRDDFNVTHTLRSMLQRK
jgi:hypothetical protein